MKNKIIAAVILVVLIGGGVWLWSSRKVKQSGANLPASADYYTNLAKACAPEQGGGASCCEQSVAFMKKNSFTKAEGGSCKFGMDKNQMLCAGSYEWCEPGSGEAQENKD